MGLEKTLAANSAIVTCGYDRAELADCDAILRNDVNAMAKVPLTSGAPFTLLTGYAPGVRNRPSHRAIAGCQVEYTSASPFSGHFRANCGRAKGIPPDLGSATQSNHCP